MEEKEPQLALQVFELPVISFEVPPPWKIEELKEFSVRAALTGIPLQRIQEDYHNRLSEALDAIRLRAELYEKPIADEEQHWKKRLAERESRRSVLLELESDGRGRVSELRKIEASSQGTIHGLLRRAKQERSSLLFEEQDRKDEHRRESEARELAHQKLIAEEKANLHTAQRNANASGIQCLLDQVDRHLKSATDLLDKARTASEDLQMRGFTPPVARFLMWASIVSIVGIASLLAPILDSRLASSETASLDINGVKGAFHIGAPGVSIFVAFGEYLLFAIMILGVLVSIIWLVFNLLKRIFPEWAEIRQTPDAAAQQSSDELGSWMSFFQIASPSVARRLANVSRKTFIQLIALVPIAFAVSMGGFLWLLVSASNAAPHAASGTIKATYICVLYTVLTCSSGSLFFITVLRPLIIGESIRKLSACLYSVLFVLPIAALMSAALLPAYHDRLALAFLGASGIAALAGFGHGLYAQGLFLREAHLERKQTHWQQARAKISYVPSAADFMPQEPLRVSVFVQTPKNAERPDSSAKRGPLGLGLFSRLMGIKESGADIAAPTTIEHNTLRKAVNSIRFPAAMIDEVNEAWAAYLEARTDRATAESEMMSLRADIDRADEDISDARKRLGRVATLKIRMYDVHQTLTLQLKNEHHQLQESILDAYRLGMKEGKISEQQDASNNGLFLSKETQL